MAYIMPGMAPSAAVFTLSKLIEFICTNVYDNVMVRVYY